VAPALEPVFAKLWAAYSRHGPTARTVTVKIKYANFQQITRSRSCAEAIALRAMIEQFSLDLVLVLAHKGWCSIGGGRGIRTSGPRYRTNRSA
jgi:nucleotidyltransferase/DNA polymerase involved in DNA repair